MQLLSINFSPLCRPHLCLSLFASSHHRAQRLQKSLQPLSYTGRSSALSFVSMSFGSFPRQAKETTNLGEAKTNIHQQNIVHQSSYQLRHSSTRETPLPILISLRFARWDRRPTQDAPSLAPSPQENLLQTQLRLSSIKIKIKSRASRTYCLHAAKTLLRNFPLVCVSPRLKFASHRRLTSAARRHKLSVRGPLESILELERASSGTRGSISKEGLRIGTIQDPP